MNRKYNTTVKRWIGKEELVRKIKEKNVEARMFQRLLFIKYLYEGDSVPQAADKVEVTLPVGYEWRNRWNEQGYDGLVPQFDGGPKSHLSEEEKQDLKNELKQRDDWTTKEVRQLIIDRFNVTYTERHVNRLLKLFGMKYGKPFQQDYRRPDDAETQLKKLDTTICSINDPDKIILGFFDECSPQTTANTQRLWSFDKPRIKKNTTKIRANTFGFYPLNGQSVLDFKEDSKKESTCDFLSLIREKNPDGAIVVILDNFRSHWAKKTREHAEDLGIHLVFLPPYSPDLNPIEYIWKSIKRVLSPMFIETADHLKSVVKEVFEKLSSKTSFAKSWVKQFQIEL